jgi:hypothetical protein
MTKAVFCIADSASQAAGIVDALRASGFLGNDISALLPDNQGTRDFAHDKATKAPEGAATGATAGGILGGALGWLVGIGSLAIPGLGPFIAAGPIMAALGGAAVGAATGGLAGTLIGLGMPEYEAKLYESKIRSGNILISVHTEDGNQRRAAKEIFERYRAHDIATSAEESVSAADKRAARVS